MNEKTGVLEQGEQLICLSLLGNSFDYFELYIENLKNWNRSIDSKKLKILLFSLEGFYECAIKFLIVYDEISGKGNDTFFENEIKSRILNNGTTSSDDYQTGNVKTIQLSECLKVAKEKQYINDEDYKIINKHKNMRNSSTHFEIKGDIKFPVYYYGAGEGHALLLKKDEFFEELKIMNKILNEIEKCSNEAIQKEEEIKKEMELQAQQLNLLIKKLNYFHGANVSKLDTNIYLKQINEILKNR